LYVAQEGRWINLGELGQETLSQLGTNEDRSTPP
jgi:hypothetical protein